MKKTATLLIISLMALCAQAQDLYIGSYYITSSTEESSHGDGKDKWANRVTIIRDLFNFEKPDVLAVQSLSSSECAQLDKLLTNHLAAGDILYHKNLQLDTCGVVDGLPEGNTCSWAKLRKGEQAFYVFNMCMTTSVDVITESAVHIRTATGEINTEKLPCFVVGYLGADENSRAYPKLTAKFNDCYTAAPVVSAELGTVNNFDLNANHGTSRYDFVFAPKTARVIAYGQLQYGYFTKESNGSYKHRLPSTHFPVMAKVAFQK